MQPLPYVPYVSDVGKSQPESSMFTLGICISAILTLAVLIIRYHQVKCLFRRPIKMNNLSLYVGCLFVFGKLITASYQLTSNVVIHYTGFGMYFVGAFLYAATQLYITRKYLQGSNNFVVFLRTISCILMFSSMVVFGFFLIPALNEYNQSGYSIGQISQWAIILGKSLFLCTLSYDFWKVGIRIEVSDVGENNLGLYRDKPVYNSTTHGTCAGNSTATRSTTVNYYDTVYFQERSCNI